MKGLRRFGTLGLALVAFMSMLLLSPAALAQSEFPVFPADNPYGAFINTHQFSIDKGATAEWRKMEGVAYDPASKRVYLAVTAIEKGMSDGQGDIQLPENKCGMVMMGELDDNFNITALKPAVVGGPYDANNKDYACNPDAIANPDNLFVDAKGNLWIGEDTSYHRNNFLWMWDGQNLNRFASLPEGAEVTGLRVQPNGTVFTNIQHPDAMNIYPYNAGVIGVVGNYEAGKNFKSVPVPQGEAARQMIVAKGDYQVLARASEPIPGSAPLAYYGEIDWASGGIQNMCNDPDGNMFLPTNEAGTEGYLYTNFECSPGGVSKQYIKQGKRGVWNVLEGHMVDFRAVGGTWNNCNASVTPWNTGLTSEEYPPDTADEWPNWLSHVDAYTRHLGYAPNPYNYGYNIELIPDGLGTKAVKHYVMGRLSKEMAQIMPDQKTAYFGDDGTDRVLYKFIADKAGDLSAGTLYAAKIKQDGMTLNIEWITLGSGNDTDIGKAIAELGPQQ